ncbi:hypothetical protein GJ496_004089 [Pomphorhynchus laevis]|nr:hypothetical protein GJ496_004089 [Pomphorhynchus laevis]
MGETVKNIILSLIEKKLLYIGQVEKYAIHSAPLVTPGAFIAKYVSDIETDNGINFEKTALVLEQLGMPMQVMKTAIIRHVCKIVSKRASALTAYLSCLIFSEMGAFVITLLAMLIGFLIGIITNNYITQGTIFKYFQTKRRYPMLNAKIESILQSLKFDTDRIIKLQEIIRNELTKGLSNTTYYEADVKMIPSKVFIVPRSIIMGSGNDLFDYLAESLYGFLKTEHLTNAHLSLGFTFSFPCNQNGLSSAKLLSWTKGFKCEGVIGKML